MRFQSVIPPVMKGKRRGTKVQPTGSNKTTFGTEEANVKVIIRVRPFIGREKKLSSNNCIDLHKAENALSITPDGAKADKLRKFTYDQVFGESDDQ